MERLNIIVNIETSPIYKIGEVIPTDIDGFDKLDVKFNNPSYVMQWTQFDLEEFVQNNSGVKDFTIEDDISCWDEKEQEKIRISYKKFFDSFTRIKLIPLYKGKELSAYHKKTFGVSFDVPKEKVQEFITFVGGK